MYNVHSMLHLADLVHEFGSLDACSSFPFENYMQQLKKLVRSGNNPISQIAKRLSELPGSIGQACKAPIRVKVPDNAFVLSDSSCGEVVEAAGHGAGSDEEVFLCRVYQKTEPLFSIPCDSRLVGIHKANSRWSTMKVLSLSKLKKKAMKIDLDSGKPLFMAILHHR